MNQKLFKLFHERNAFQRYLCRRWLFKLFQSCGFHITGNHFYELVPDTRLMAAKYSDAPRALTGINWRFTECEGEAVRLIKTYGPEYQKERGRFGFSETNNYYRGCDALTLFAFLRDLKPAKMIEIGQGSSTQIALAALDLNATETGRTCDLISIDPYPRLSQNQAPKGVNLAVFRQELQAVNMEPLLENCNFLFVDSSHVYKFGSDAEFEFTKIYPQLRPGTYVHLHDIYSPYHYPLDWALREKRFWNEQYFWENFLAFNGAFEITMPLQLLMRQSATLGDALRALNLGPDFFDFDGRAMYFQRKQI